MGSSDFCSRTNSFECKLKKEKNLLIIVKVLVLSGSDTLRPKRIPTQNFVMWRIWTLFPPPFRAVNQLPDPRAAYRVGIGA